MITCMFQKSFVMNKLGEAILTAIGFLQVSSMDLINLLAAIYLLIM